MTLLAFLLVGCMNVPTSPVRTQSSSEAVGSSSEAQATSLHADDDVSLYDARRVTKKSFGTYITVATSPVQPERFSGWHTGVDFELLPLEDEHALGVNALCAGAVLFAGRVKGYGGVLVQSCVFGGEPVTVLYGHLDPASVRQKGLSVEKGDRLGHLGRGFGDETDGERPHLHLSVHKGAAPDFRGYVQSEAALEGWLDPVEVFRMR